MTMTSRPLFAACLLLAHSALLAVAAWSRGPAVPYTEPSAVQNSFYFESHGRDDVRQWRTALIKGAQYLKVDFNFVEDSSVCRSMRNAVSSDGTFPNGCFILSHYINPQQVNYNTSFDIIAFLNNTANWVLLARNPPTVIQMCLKNYPGPLCGSSHNSSNVSASARKWMALMDEFYSLAVPIADTSLQGRVRFVFDALLGDGDNCTVSRWPGWVSTWPGYPLSFVMNTTAAEKDPWVRRFDMLNIAASNPNWRRIIEGDMMRFEASPFAVVGWEPSDEWSLRAFFTQFAALATAHTPGILSAFNPDPAMWHVLTAGSTGRFNHEPFGPELAASPVSCYIGEISTLLTLSFLEHSPDTISVGLHVRRPNGRFLLHSEGTVGPVPGLGDALQAASATAVEGGFFVVLAGSSGCFIGLTLNSTTMEVAVAAKFAGPSVSCAVLPHLPAGALNISVAVRCDAGSEKLGGSASASVEFAAAVRTASRVVLWRFAAIAVAALSGGNTTQLQPPGPPIDVTSYPGGAFDSGFALHFAVHSSSIDGSQDAAREFVVTWSAGRKVFVSCVTERPSLLPRADRASPDVHITPPVAAPWFHIGTGRRPSVHIDSGPEAHLLLVWGDSYCQNSMAIDDSEVIFFGAMACDMNRQPFIEFTEEPVNGYIFGTFANLWNTIADAQTPAASSSAPPWGIANTCSETLFHGSFDLGYQPSATLIRADATHDTAVQENGFIAVAALVSPLTQSVSTCANPVPHNGRVVIDAFPLMGQPVPQQ